jgi:hypothetical protein
LDSLLKLSLPLSLVSSHARLIHLQGAQLLLVGSILCSLLSALEALYAGAKSLTEANRTCGRAACLQHRSSSRKQPLRLVRREIAQLVEKSSHV